MLLHHNLENLWKKISKNLDSVAFMSTQFDLFNNKINSVIIDLKNIKIENEKNTFIKGSFDFKIEN